MAFTKVLPSGISSASTLTVDSLDSVGAISATSINATTGTFSGNLNVAGVLTYEDVTNVDSIGLVTARSGIHVTGGSVGIGTDNPGANLQITANNPGILFQDANSGATESKIEGSSGHLFYTTDNLNRDHIFSATGESEALRITGDGSVGIGTDNPTTKLYATDTQNGYVSYTFVNDSNGSGAVNRIQLGNDASPGSAQLVVYGSQHSTLPNVFDINNANNNDMRLLTNNTERLRITASGNVGIGTDNPLQELHVYSNGGAYAIIQSSNSSSNAGILFGDSDNYQIGSVIYENANDALTFVTNGTERLRIDATGSMGLGVVPEPQGSGFSNFQFGGLGNLGASSAQSAGGAIYLYNNVYRATVGQWYYLVTDEATRYQALNGRHQFDVAPSGTADTVASFAEKVRIDTDGMKFNGDTAAANALDDYEEGTWTPRLNGWTGSTYTNVTNTTSYTAGRYVKVGGFVTVYIDYTWSSMPIASNHPWYIYDLPFTPETNHASAGSIGTVVGVTNAYSMDIIKSAGYTNQLFIYSRSSNSATTNITNTGGAGSFRASITYYTLS